METSRFFGGPAGAIPEYNQTHDAEVYRLMFSYGVFDNVENKLAVTETDPLSLGVKVDTGWAFVHGFWYHNDSALTKSLGAADPTYARIDRIILRLDSTTSFKISCEVKEGTPAASPSPPDLTQTDAIYEISLAKVTVGAGVTSISNANITDERSFAEDKGLVNVVKLTGDQTIAGIKTFSNTPKMDAIAEKSGAHGVIIDGVLIKDNLVTSGIAAYEESVISTSIESSETPTPARASKKTEYVITALAADATFGAPTGTPANGDLLLITVKDNGTARTLDFNEIYTAPYSADKPTTTTAGKTLIMLFRYNSASSKWELLYVDKEA